MEPLVVAAAEIAQLLGVGRARVHQLIAAGDFPKPVAMLSVGKVWLTQDVRAWANSTGRTVHPVKKR
jgi:predicted DNA-binding transcriptional regulator AlpA